MLFIVSFLAWPLHGQPAFETTLTLAVVGTGLLFSTLYFRSVDCISLNEGIRIGSLWFAISLVLDLAMFMPGSSPMHMPFSAHMLDIGLMYLN